MRSRSLALLVAGTAACGATSNAAAPAPPASECADEIVAVTFNVRRGKPTDGEHDWEHRREAVGELLRGLDADVIGLQEPFAHQIDDLQRMLPAFRWEGAGRDDGARGGEHAPVFFRKGRFERVAGGTFWLSPTPERPRAADEEKPWGTHLNRVVSWALLRDRRSGLRLLAMSAHLDNESELARQESARQIVAFVAAHPADQVLLLADLNTEAGTAPFVTLATALRDAADGAPQVVRNALGTTVTRWTALSEPGRHIDHILFAGRLRPRVYEVIDRRAHYSGAPRFLSDHLPVRARLCVQFSR